MEKQAPVTLPVWWTQTTLDSFGSMHLEWVSPAVGLTVGERVAVMTATIGILTGLMTSAMRSEGFAGFSKLRRPAVIVALHGLMTIFSHGKKHKRN